MNARIFVPIGIAHRGFVERVEQFAAQIQTGAAPNLEELAGFMRQWLIAHILSTDKELGIALNAHAVR